MNSANVLVLLSTYNGEKYIIEQLDSIISQKDVDVAMLIRDDGSKDKTVNIIKKYMADHPNIKLTEGQNVGFVKSFSALVQHAASLPPFDFYAFADQDDIWYESKLYTGAQALSKLSQDQPNLFGSNSQIVDSSGRPLRSFYKNERFFTPANLTFCDFVQGCSMLFNKKALDFYNAHPPVKCWHDRWMVMICTYLGNIVYDHNKLFGYRVHRNNTLMSNDTTSSPSFLKVAFNNIKSLLIRNNNREQQLFLKEFYEIFKDGIPKQNQKYIIHYLNYSKNIASKLYLLSSTSFSPVIHKYYLLTWLNLKAGIILNKI